MSPFDARPNGTDEPPTFDQVNHLSVEDLKNIIAQAQTGTADPITVSMQIFNSLGGDTTLAGDVLRQALTDSGLAMDGPLSLLVVAIESIVKNGDQIRVSNTSEIKAEIGGASIKFNRLVTFDAGTDGGFPTITNMKGVAVHKLLWFDIRQIQVKQDQGKRILHVGTSGGSRDFPLP